MEDIIKRLEVRSRGLTHDGKLEASYDVDDAIDEIKRLRKAIEDTAPLDAVTRRCWDECTVYDDNRCCYNCNKPVKCPEQCRVKYENCENKRE